MKNATAILSMLHELPARNSATRTFRDEPVLSWTLERLSRSLHLGSMAILCWQDQLPQVTPIAAEHGACVLSKNPRVLVPSIQSILAARKWSDGWRGGLLGTCDFDLGFHAAWSSEIIAQLSSEAVILVDPAAALVDWTLIDGLIEHARRHPGVQFCFTPAAPGLAGILIKPSLLQQLAAGGLHPGRILSYLPDQPVRDPIASDACVHVPAPIARTTRSFKLDSDRQIARITEAAVNLNGELLSSDALALLNRLEWSNRSDPLPREIVLELNTRRLSRAVFSPNRYHQIDRPNLSRDLARKVLRELAQADDARLTLSGVGDPLLHPELNELLNDAREASVHALHLETDLLIPDAAQMQRLVESDIDVISVCLPATTRRTYEWIMGVDGLDLAIENIRRFVLHRQQLGRGTPILVPVFTKCQQNLGEMEQWYDQWLRALGCAVITGPTDFAGQIPDLSVADMSPRCRRPCTRLASRLSVLSDGTAVACEQDVLARHVVGNLKFDSLAVVWNGSIESLRQSHLSQRYDAHPLCTNCREWHRP